MNIQKVSYQNNQNNNKLAFKSIIAEKSFLEHPVLRSLYENNKSALEATTGPFRVVLEYCKSIEKPGLKGVGAFVLDDKSVVIGQAGFSIGQIPTLPEMQSLIYAAVRSICS